MNSFNFQSEYPLHVHVWHNSVKDLRKCLETEAGRNCLEKKDIRGRTPLMLAVSLGFFECVKLLLNANANVNIDDQHGFNVLHEAIATNDPELVQLVMEKRGTQRTNKRLRAIPSLLRKIRDTPDFYVEMKWEFTSWLPLVSRFCPSDTYKIYKSGASVRVDTTLSGFEQMNWQRGSRAYIFSAYEDGAKFIDIDHDNRQAHIENMVLSELTEPINSFFSSGSDVMAQARLTCPTSITYLDTEKIQFERTRAGIIGFRSEKNEIVNGYECKVFSANNVQVVTKVRTEHLSDQDKQNYKDQMVANQYPFQSLLGTVEIVEKADRTKLNELQQQNSTEHSWSPCNPGNITLEQYFDADFDMTNRDIGRPKEMTTRTNKFKANLWLSEQFPLSLQEQVLPIIDLMAISSSHFQRLKDFITLQLPSGFPVKIEIPLFHIVSARITFGNIFSLNEPVNGVQPINDGTAVACVVDENIFDIPSNYSLLGCEEEFVRPRRIEEIDYFRLHNRAAVNGRRPRNIAPSNDPSETDLQRAIEESLKDMQKSSRNSSHHKNGKNGSLSSSNSPTTSSGEASSSDQTVNSSPKSDSSHEAHFSTSSEEQEVMEKILKLSLIEQ